MSKIWIPKCGDAVSLEKDWSFKLHAEYRNVKFINKTVDKKLSDDSVWHDKYGKQYKYMLVSGTELVFDRVYIRQDNNEYASVTFVVKNHPNDDLIGERFWVKLDDANTMEATFTSAGNPVGMCARAKFKSEVKNKKDPAAAQKSATAKANRDGLKAAKEAVTAAFREKKFEKHVDSIVRKVFKEKGWKYTKSSAQYEIDMISYEIFPVSSKKNSDGSLTRVFETKFWSTGVQKYDSFKVFVVTTLGADVVSVTPYVE